MNIRKIEAITRDAFYERSRKEKKLRKKQVKRRIKEAAAAGKNFIYEAYIDEELVEKLKEDGFCVDNVIETIPTFKYRVSWENPALFDERI